MPRWMADSISSGLGGVIFGGLGPVVACGDRWIGGLVASDFDAVVADFSASESDAAPLELHTVSAKSATTMSQLNRDAREVVTLRSIWRSAGHHSGKFTLL